MNNGNYDLIDVVTKSTHPVFLIHPVRLTTQNIGYGCLITYKGKLFFISIVDKADVLKGHIAFDVGVYDRKKCLFYKI
jgi:hypothetical protein